LIMYNTYTMLTESVFLAAGRVPVELPGSIMFFGLVFTIIGLTSIIYPRIFWYLRVGRKLQGAPPGKLYLWVLRFGGLLVVVIGLLMLYTTGTLNP